MNKKERNEELARLTARGTSAAVASKSQRTPLQNENISMDKKKPWVARTRPVSRELRPDRTYNCDDAGETSQQA